MLSINGEEFPIRGTILDTMLRLGINPDSYLFLIDGTPVPSDLEPSEEQTVRAIRVASGG